MSFFERLQQETAVQRQHLFTAPVVTACLQGRISRETYIAFLSEAYHHVKHTVPLLMACGGRLGMEYEWLRQAIGEYIEEEKGHHEWILNDIRACDADAQAVEQGRAGMPIDLMVSYLYHQIDRENPIAFFGMVQVLEGTSVELGGQMAKLAQQHLQLPDSAMTYLTSHSVLDQDHIKLFAGLMNRIEREQDQQAIIRAANTCYRLYGDMLRMLPLPQESEEGLNDAA